jgi:phosphatidate cytidylyltransferase
MGNLAKRIIVAIFGIPLLIVLTYLGGWYFFVIICIISSVAQWEFYQLQKNKDISPYSLIGILVGIIILITIKTALWQWGGLLAIVALMMIMSWEMIYRKQNMSANIGTTLMGIFYIPILLGTLLHLRCLVDDLMPNTKLAGFKFIALIYITIWICDTFAYAFGSWLGKHKLYAKVSPNKSVEGSIAGLFGCLITLSMVKLLDFFPLTWFDIVLFGLVIGLVGQIGDFVESWLKRDNGVKDTSTLLPGHGGMLDRFDSLIFVSPAMLILAKIFF